MSHTFDTEAYGPVFAGLIGERRINPLDPGTPNTAVSRQLDAATVESAFEGKSFRDEDMARSCLSAVWLYHNFLDESHTMSQQIPTATGSYWHGIMHRREPDFSNSKYWFGKVGIHPVFDSLCEAARNAAHSVGASALFLREQSVWDPMAFIDLCEGSLSARNDAEAVCREVQQCEWEILFDFSYHHATGE